MRLSVLILSFSLFSINLHAYTTDKIYKITVLHTNDHHGHFWQNKDGEGGLMARATLIKNIREEVKKGEGYLLLLDAGDVNTGPPQSNLLDAEPDFLGMRQMGYDVMTIGNHEFDKPLETIFKQQKWGGFPFISANIFDKKCQEHIFPSTIKKQFEDLSITVLGLTTEDTVYKSNPKNTNELCFKPVIDVACELVPQIRLETDVLIVISHIGYYPNETNGNDAPGDVTLARQVPGIDLIVGGHSHTALFVPDIQNGTSIVQAGESGKYLGRSDLEFKNGKITLKKYELIPVNPKDTFNKIAEDVSMKELLQPFKEKADTNLFNEIGLANGEFIGRREVVRFQETNLGNLVAGIFKNVYKADIGLVNSGGLRDSIYPGKITIESILQVLPFESEIVLASIKGVELKEYLNFALNGSMPGTGGFPQLSGVSAILEKNTWKILELKVNGKEIEDERIYKIALPEFVANGGDKYPRLSFIKFGYIDANVVSDYILENKNLKVEDFSVKNYINIQVYTANGSLFK